jgi:hypothetical protein
VKVIVKEQKDKDIILKRSTQDIITAIKAKELKEAIREIIAA